MKRKALQLYWWSRMRSSR